MQNFFESEEHTYSSTQVDAPKELADKVLGFSATIPEEELYIEDGEYGREDEIHVTIKYGLVTDKAEDIRELLKQTIGDEPMDVPATITVRLGETSIFEAKGDSKFDVLKVSVESEDLIKLHKLFSQLENGDEHPDYKPHMTIAYLKAGIGEKYVGKKDFDGETFTVNSFWFKGKTGADSEIDL